MLFLLEIKVLEARQRLEALVIPKRQALKRLQGLLAPLLEVDEMAFPQQLKTSIFRLIGYIPKIIEDSGRRRTSEGNNPASSRNKDITPRQTLPWRYDNSEQ